jgi:hypothetical protein
VTSRIRWFPDFEMEMSSKSKEKEFTTGVSNAISSLAVTIV